MPTLASVDSLLNVSAGMVVRTRGWDVPVVCALTVLG